MRLWIGFILICIAAGMFFGGMARSSGKVVHTEAPTNDSTVSQIVVVESKLPFEFVLTTAIIGLAGVVLVVLPRRRPTPPPLQ